MTFTCHRGWIVGFRYTYFQKCVIENCHSAYKVKDIWCFPALPNLRSDFNFIFKLTLFIVKFRINETLLTGEVFLLGYFPKETSPAETLRCFVFPKCPFVFEFYYKSPVSTEALCGWLSVLLIIATKTLALSVVFTSGLLQGHSIVVFWALSRRHRELWGKHPIKNTRSYSEDALIGKSRFWENRMPLWASLNWFDSPH